MQNGNELSGLFGFWLSPNFSPAINGYARLHQMSAQLLCSKQRRIRQRTLDRKNPRAGRNRTANLPLKIIGKTIDVSVITTAGSAGSKARINLQALYAGLHAQNADRPADFGVLPELQAVHVFSHIQRPKTCRIVIAAVFLCPALRHGRPGKPTVISHHITDNVTNAGLGNAVAKPVHQAVQIHTTLPARTERRVAIALQINVALQNPFGIEIAVHLQLCLEAKILAQDDESRGRTYQFQRRSRLQSLAAVDSRHLLVRAYINHGKTDLGPAQSRLAGKVIGRCLIIRLARKYRRGSTQNKKEKNANTAHKAGNIFPDTSPKPMRKSPFCA